MQLKHILLAAAALAAVACAYEKDGDVLVLTDNDLEDAIKEHEYLLVEFYAPWCGHCKRLEPEYSKAATKLAKLDPPISIAKVDATQHSKSASKYGVRGYPTIKWFVNGKDSEYGGGRTADAIVQWVKKKTGPPCKPLADSAAVDSFKDSADVVVVAFQDTSSEDFKKIEDAARGIEDIEVGVADEAAAKAAGEAFPSLVLYKKFDEGKNVFEGELNADAVQEFVTANSIPLVSTFSQESAPKIFGSGVETHFLYFNDEKSDSHDGIMKQLGEVAKEYKGKTLFVFVPSSEERVMSYFDFKKEDLPKAILVSLGEGDMKKFGFEGELTADSIKKHVAAYHTGELKPTLKSEEPPSDNSGPVKVIVGTTFEEIVLDPKKDVFVEFYAPWCGHCKSLAPTWDKLGERFAYSETVTIAKVDATANDIDHPGVNVRGFPTIMLFPHDKKDKPVTYDGGRDLDDLVEWLTKNAKTLDGKAPEPPKHTEL